MQDALKQVQRDVADLRASGAPSTFTHVRRAKRAIKRAEKSPSKAEQLRSHIPDDFGTWEAQDRENWLRQEKIFLDNSIQVTPKGKAASNVMLKCHLVASLLVTLECLQGADNQYAF